jgi:hypothetical protein
LLSLDCPTRPRKDAEPCDQGDSTCRAAEKLAPTDALNRGLSSQVHWPSSFS